MLTLRRCVTRGVTLEAMLDPRKDSATDAEMEGDKAIYDELMLR